MKPKIILTCEHADFQTPKFIDSDWRLPLSILRDHVGWDKGAWGVVKEMQKLMACQSFHYPYSRLYIDANRAVNEKALSPYMRGVPLQIEEKLLRLSSNYRQPIERKVEKLARAKSSVFVYSVHSFVPQLKGKTRSTDIGLLYRTTCQKEVSLAKAVKQRLKKEAPTLNVHFNRPYRGHTDCFLNDLLDQHLPNPYVNGLFIEINQRLLKNPSAYKKIAGLLVDTLQFQ